MATIPDISTERRPTPSPAGGVARYTPVDTSSVGAIHARGGAALKAGAKALGLGGAALSAAVQDAEEDLDRVAVEDAFNKARREQLRLTSSPDGFLHVKGNEALKRKLYAEYDEKFQTSMEGISAGLENDNQKQAFARRAEVVRLQFNGDTLNHVRSESDAAAKATHLATVEVEKQAAAESYADPAAVAMSIERIKRSIEDYATREGWSPEVREAAVKDEVSSAHVGVIEHMLVVNPPMAKAYYAEHKSEVVGKARTKIEATLKVADTQRQGQASADAIMLRFNEDAEDFVGEVEKAREAARSIADPARRDDALRRVNKRINEAGQMRAMETDQYKDQAWQLALAGRDIPAPIEEHLRRRSAADWQAIESYAISGAPAASYPEAQARLWDAYTAATTGDSDAFLHMDMRQYYPQLTVADRAKFERLQAGLISSDAATRSKTTAAGRSQAQVMSVIDDQLVAAGHDKVGPELVALQDRLFTEVDAWHEQHPGQKVPESLLRQWAKEYLSVGVARGWFTSMFLDDTPIYQMSNDEIRAEIPAQAYKETTIAIRKEGEIPTPGRVLYYWREKQKMQGN